MYPHCVRPTNLYLQHAQAGKADKRLAKGNAQTLQFYGIALLVSILLHLVIRIYYFGDMTTLDWVLSGSTAVAAISCYSLMVAQSRFGGDLNLAGATSEYFKDIVTVGSAVLTLSIISTKFFGLWLFVLGYILVKAVKMLIPWISPPPPPPMDAATAKRLAKKERQAELQQRRAKGK
eukprot:m.197181 g.197181  ORF g.197181 m.197181 type:complete len:177 (-) comp18710_c0_seq7:1274-1804(-)